MNTVLAASMHAIGCHPIPVVGNIAALGRAYRDGLIDAFQVRAMADWMSDRRFRMFDFRWRVNGGEMPTSEQVLAIVQESK